MLVLSQNYHFEIKDARGKDPGLCENEENILRIFPGSTKTSQGQFMGLKRQKSAP